MAVRLVNLVIERLKEEFPGHNIASVYRNMAASTCSQKESDLYDVYINNTFIVEVNDEGVAMRIPPSDGYSVYQEVSYSAADPKFFYHLVGTAKLIFQRYQDAVDDGLRGAQYFGFNS